MQPIADWLTKLGLGQYAERFADNDIDVPVLHHLTDHNLEKIGVSLGHRRKMPGAVAWAHSNPVDHSVEARSTTQLPGLGQTDPHRSAETCQEARHDRARAGHAAPTIS